MGDNFAWLGTPSAIWLDTLATPAAFVAGTVVSAAVMTDLPPMVKWTTAIIAGGGVAGLTQGVTAALRANSTALTGGLGNLVISTAEHLVHSWARFSPWRRR